MTESERSGEQPTAESSAGGVGAKRKSALGDPDASLIEQMGGVRGLVFSSIPILTFVPVNAFWGLTVAMWAAIGVAVAMLAWSLARRDNPQPAISGFIGVAICVLIAWRTGSAKGYFLYGIITQAVYGGAFALSALARWPLVGVIWGFLDGKGMAWRAIPRARRWYAVATWMWAGLFAIRAVLQYALYLNDEVNWLGAARIGMGWPLAILAFAGTVWAVRRATVNEKDLTENDPAATDVNADQTSTDENDGIRTAEPQASDAGNQPSAGQDAGEPHGGPPRR